MICTNSPSTAAPAATASATGLQDPVKRGLVILLLAKGYSRRMAAEFVGCHPATITRTAERDPKFREALVETEAQISLVALERIQAAAQNPRYWRAAAWILERKRPEEWGRPQPNTVKLDQLAAILRSVLDTVAATGVSAEQLAQVEDHVQEILADVAPTAGHDRPSEPASPPSAAADPSTPAPAAAPATQPPAAAIQPVAEPSEPPARNALPESSVVTPSPQPVSDQPVASPDSSAGRATPIEGVAQQRSKKRKDQRKCYGLPFGRPTGWSPKRATVR